MPCLIPLVAGPGAGGGGRRGCKNTAACNRSGDLRNGGNSAETVAVYAHPPKLIWWQTGKQPVYLGHYFIK